MSERTISVDDARLILAKWRDDAASLRVFFFRQDAFALVFRRGVLQVTDRSLEMIGGDEVTFSVDLDRVARFEYGEPTRGLPVIGTRGRAHGEVVCGLFINLQHGDVLVLVETKITSDQSKMGTER